MAANQRTQQRDRTSQALMLPNCCNTIMLCASKYNLLSLDDRNVMLALTACTGLIQNEQGAQLFSGCDLHSGLAKLVGRLREKL